MTLPPERTDPATFSDRESYKNILEKEIKEMISTLTHRLSDLQKQPQKNHHPLGSGTSNHHDHNHNHRYETNDDEHGVQVITLAGSNTGATMRGGLDSDKSSSPLGTKDMEPTMDSYVNSNVQAINNSIMMGGSYSSKDPGVHLDITDYDHEQPHDHIVGETKKHGGKHKEKKKEKHDSKSDHDHSEHDKDH